MSERKVIPESCCECKYSSGCYAYYGEGTCRYKIAIEERDRKAFSKNRKEGDSNDK